MGEGKPRPLRGAEESEEEFLERLLRMLEVEEYRRVGIVRTLHLDIYLYQ